MRGNVNWMYARRRSMASDLLGPRPRQDVADHPARPVRYRLHRQCAGNAGRRRLFAGACHDDADPGGLGRQPADGSGAPGLLRILRRADGALGRAGGDRVHRWPADRRHARSQRPAPRALHRHRRRPCDHGLGVRRAAGPRGAHPPQVAAAARQDAADRPRPGPHHRGRRDQNATSPPPIPMPTGSRPPSSSWRICRTPKQRAAAAERPGGAANQQQAFGYTQEDIQFFLEPMARAGDDPIGSMGTDTPLAVLSDKAEAALQLLQTELRSGNQSADRSDPRRTGDVAGLDDRAAAEPSGPSRRQPLSAGGRATDPDQRRSGEDPRHREPRRWRVSHRDDRHHLARQRRRRGHGTRGRARLP